MRKILFYILFLSSFVVSAQDDQEFIEGCTYDIFLEYNPLATINNGSCETLISYGCTDTLALNYNPIANTDNGTCIIVGCMDSIATNYYELANQDDGNCIIEGCMDSQADNYNSNANLSTDNCIISGCMIELYPNYNELANNDDGSCSFPTAKKIIAGEYFWGDDPGESQAIPIYALDGHFDLSILN